MKYKNKYIQRCFKETGGKFEYDESNYKSCRDKISIKCIKHDVWFEQIPYSNRIGITGCPCCIKENAHYSKEEFIAKAIEKHGNKYSYENVDYKNSVTEVAVTCPIHGDFMVKPKNHLYKDGCRWCFYDTRRVDKDHFVKKAKEIHGEKYDYSESIFCGVNNKIEIVCPEHGPFSQNANNHLHGRGCPQCNFSRGELKISEILTKKGIRFETQKKFKGCIDKISLRFDFYLPDFNTVIEYHGRQHYMPVAYFGGQAEFKARKRRDKIKKDWCLDNNIGYIEIPYNSKIENKLSRSLDLA